MKRKVAVVNVAVVDEAARVADLPLGATVALAKVVSEAHGPATSSLAFSGGAACRKGAVESAGDFTESKHYS
jgi:hypothetical protein